ncbi:aspartate/glutamate racemase family protein [Blastococcus sp. TML/M2B]|uniref:aspartate/glutamate racemase family protein n=1 Tax=Blastococcus sp. TML/M2B TaxID=2798727 RepID=UPI001F5B421D|nr:aspartate/glutamate racemase family protein [Blastococcus sp. TML/M2B]
MGTTQPGADAPIGIFDSGVGGLTVARAVLDQLPGEAIRYIGDTANGPYGPLPIAEVRRHSLAVMDGLVADGVKMLVVACNSASAASLRDARERYDVPVVEVVLPAVRRATAATRTGRIGVIGTQATITSGAYEDAFAAVPGLTVTSAACPSFVDFVERRGDQRPAAARARAVLPRPAARRGRGHRRPGVHALPAADRCAVPGAG